MKVFEDYQKKRNSKRLKLKFYAVLEKLVSENFR